MGCPVCGHPDARALCSQCGTDLRALSGEDGPSRLAVVAVSAAGPSRAPSKK